jgi:hypothetical protein
MKTIKEAAREKAAKCLNAISEFEFTSIRVKDLEVLLAETFKAGVEFAQRWIPVDEELPNEGEKLPDEGEKLPNEGEVVYIVVEHRISDKFVQKRYSIGTCKINAFTGERWITDNNHGLGRTTHWRKIELT